MNQVISTGFFTVGGAIIGAIITAFATWQITKKKGLQQLSILESKLTQMIGVESSIKDKLEIFYNKTPINSLFSGTFYAINTGNKCIEDIEIKLYPQESSKIFDPELVNSSFEHESDFISIENINNIAIISIKYLNKNESCQFNYKVFNGKEKARISFRKKGIETVINQVSLSSSPDIFEEAIEELFDKTPWYILISFKMFKKILKN